MFTKIKDFFTKNIIPNVVCLLEIMQIVLKIVCKLTHKYVLRIKNNYYSLSRLEKLAISWAMVLALLPISVKTVYANGVTEDTTAIVGTYEIKVPKGAEMPTTNELTSVATITSETTSLSDGWYVVTGDVTIDDTVTIASGKTPNIILQGGASLTVEKGIHSISGEGNLNIWEGLSSTGTLIVNGYADEWDYVYGIYLYDLPHNGGDIKVNVPTSSDTSYGIRLHNNLIQNKGSILAYGGVVEDGGSYGISTQNLIQNNGSIETVGGDSKYSSVGLDVTDGLTQNGGSINSRTGISNESSSYGIYVNIALTQNDGTITASGNEAHECSYGIYVYNSDITQNDGIIIATGGDMSADNSKSMGISLQQGNLKQNNGSIVATGGSAKDASYGIYEAWGSLEQFDGSICATGGEATGISYGIYADGAVTQNGGSITATGGAVSNVGSYGLYVDSTVTQSGGSIMATGGVASNGDSYGLYAESTVTQSGGSITATGGVASNGDSYGLFAYDELTQEDGCITTMSSQNKAIYIWGSANFAGKIMAGENAESAISSNLDTAKASKYAKIEVIPVAQIGTKAYASIAKALTASHISEDDNNPTVIKLIADDEENFEIESDRYVTLDLNGYVLSPKDTEEYLIKNNGVLNIIDSGTTVHYFKVTSFQPYSWYPPYEIWVLTTDTTDIANAVDLENLPAIPSVGTVVKVTGGVITNPEEDWHSTIYNNYGALLTLNGGNYIGNYCNEHGSVLYNDGDAIINDNVLMAGNRATDCGGAIYVSSDGNTKMNGGIIAYNSSNYGGAVDCGSGTFHMFGGNMRYNRAKKGGAIYNESYDSFHMHGGNIIQNYALKKGGGVYNGANISFDGDCIVKDNYAFNEYEADDENPVFGSTEYDYSSENTYRIVNNVYLDYSNLQIGTGWDEAPEYTPMGTNSHVGITISESGYGEFSQNGVEADRTHFFSDNDAYYVKFVSDHLELAISTVKISSSITNGTVTVSNQGADIAETVTVTATPSANYVLDSITVKDSIGADIVFNSEAKTFVVPDSNLPVIVSATFTVSPNNTPGGNNNGGSIFIPTNNGGSSSSSSSSPSSTSSKPSVGESVVKEAANGSTHIAEQVVSSEEKVEVKPVGDLKETDTAASLTNKSESEVKALVEAKNTDELVKAAIDTSFFEVNVEMNLATDKTSERITSANLNSSKIENLAEAVAGILTPEEMMQVLTGKDTVRIDVEVDETKTSAPTPVTEVMNANHQVANVLDVNIFKTINGIKSKMTEVGKEVAITINVGTAITNKKDVQAIRLHDGKAEYVKTINNQDGSITVYSDLYSEFVIVTSKEEETKPVVSPVKNTGSSILDRVIYFFKRLF